MIYTRTKFIHGVLAVLMLSACGKKNDPPHQNGEKPQPPAAVKSSPVIPGQKASLLDRFTRHHTKKIQSHAPQSGPDPQLFLESLPASLPGMTPMRTSATRIAQSGQFHIQAETVFQDRRGRTLFLRLGERPLMKGWSESTLALAGKADMAVADAEGYTRSGSFQGHPSVERYRKHMHSCQLNVMIGPTLVLECRAINMNMTTLKQQLKAWDISELESLAQALPPASRP